MTKQIEKYFPGPIEYRETGPVTGKAPKITFGNAVLMVINAQNEYLDGALAIPDISPAVTEISRLLARARASGTPIMYLQHVDQPGGLFDPGGRGGRFIDVIAPDNDEYIVQKTAANGFAATNLAAQLEHIGRKKLIIAGFMTHMCVSFTARAAVELGYPTSVVANACAGALLSKVGMHAPENRGAHRLALSTLAGSGVELVDGCDQIPDEHV
ncbi:MAG: cysteine hydrolase [Fimbriimonadaceae bacterium]|nr:cysteine hydrolase [Alphaproteobacteria bacterium]